MTTQHTGLRVLGQINKDLNSAKTHLWSIFGNRGVTIRHGHDTIRISICVSRYDPYLDTYNICYFLII